MFRLSRLSDYAIVLTSRIARGNGLVVTARGLSSETDIPWPTVVKLLKMLMAGGVLRSIQGRKGGYALARPASKISLIDIIEMIEGPVALTECNRETGNCGIQTSCQVHRHWRVINNAVRQSLAAITLADMNGATRSVARMAQNRQLRELV
jgi:FeS assembly SUF system regulator